MGGRHGKGSNQKPTIIVHGLEPLEPAPHSGAWKVAYADFVTAMMAFFLVMWLINATTEAQRRGLANYFAPTNSLSFHSSGSGKPFGGHTPFSSGQDVSNEGAVQAITGKAEPEPNATPDATVKTPGSEAKGAGDGGAKSDAGGVRTPRASGHAVTPLPGPAARPASWPAGPDVGAPALPPTPSAPAAAREEAALQGAAAAIRKAIAADPGLARLSVHFAVDVTARGLRIQILDGKRRPMFAFGSAELTAPARAFLARLAPILARLGNPVAISGYTDAAPYRGRGMSNWELSADRANMTRRLLVAGGLAAKAISRVSGYADRDLLLPADPLAAANRRVAMLVLRSGPAPAAPPARPVAAPR